MNELINKVESWARDRQIIPNSNPQAQLMKTVSELGELADATLKNDRPGIVDGVGDVIVTLVIYAALQGVKLEDCLASAYGEIRDRRGHADARGRVLQGSGDMIVSVKTRPPCRLYDADGREVLYAVWADTETGEAIQYVRRDDKFVIENDEVVKEKRQHPAPLRVEQITRRSR